MKTLIQKSSGGPDLLKYPKTHSKPSCDRLLHTQTAPHLGLSFLTLSFLILLSHPPNIFFNIFSFHSRGAHFLPDFFFFFFEGGRESERD